MKKLLLAMAGVLALSGAATAADMPVKAVEYIDTWNGFYWGIGVGAKYSRTNWDTTCLGLSGAQAGANALCPVSIGALAGNPGFPIEQGTAHPVFTNTAGRVTSYAGWNWQFAHSWLFGVEGDVGYSNGSSWFKGIPGCVTTCGVVGRTGPSPVDAASVRTTWDLSLRGRLGFIVADNVLLYGTGGVAFQSLAAVVQCTQAPAVWCVTGRRQENGDLLMGYTVGGGIDWRLTKNWIARAEYRFSDYRTLNTVFFSGTGDEVWTSLKLRTQVATIGLAYKFGDWPVVAKY